MARATRNSSSAAKAIKKAPAAKASKKPPSKQASASKKKPSGAARAQGSNKERIVGALASQFAMGFDKPDRKTIMGLALITSAKSFANILPDLKKRDGLVDYDSKCIWLTDAGKDHVGEDALAVPTDNGPMQEKLRSTMLKSKKEREVFDFLTDGKWYTRQEIADSMGHAFNKSFQNAVGAVGKVCEKQGGKMRLKDMCFPAGRPGDEDA